MGAFQILAEPLLLDFTSSTVLGITETVCACGMLVSSLLLGIRGIKKGYVKVLCLSLLLADGIAKGMKLGVGRGAAAVIILSGVLLGLTAAVLYRIRLVKELETQLPEEPEQSEDKT